MPNFTYSARDNNGKVIEGKLEARDAQAVAEILQDRGLIVVNIKEKKSLDLEELSQINIGGVPMKDKVVFMRQLATMVNAGLPLTRGLQIMEQQITNPLFKKTISDVKVSVEAGKSLADSFRNTEEVFDDITVNLIEAGESSGNLGEILNKLATELENKNKLQGKIKGALTYPIILLVIIVAVVVLMMLVLVPAMSDIYTEFGGELPTITKIMVSLSNFFINY